MSMGGQIVEWFQKNRERVFLLLGVILVGVLCFEAGLLQGRVRPETPLVLSLPVSPESSSDSKGAGSAASSLEPVVAKSDGSANCVFVGSKNSTKYHLTTCAAAKRIKPENRVCFASKEEAEKRGYRPSCLK